MNKAQLIEALTVRLGDKKTATVAVDSLVDVIVRSVHKGDKVNITGFGVFEKRARAARTARNPRTGETVRVRKTNVPAFRAGSTFKEVVSGAKKLPRTAVPTRSTASSTRTSSTRTASTRTASRSAAASRRTTTRTAATSRTRAAATRPATRTAGKASAKASTGSRTVVKKKTTAKAAPKKTVAKVAPKKTVAKAKAKPMAKKAAPKKGKR